MTSMEGYGGRFIEIQAFPASIVVIIVVAEVGRRRIKAVSTELERIRARERERMVASQSESTLRVKPSGLVKQLVETLNLSSWLSTEKAKIQLAMAGYRGAGAEYAFLACRLIAPIAFFLAAIIYQFLIIKWNQPAMVKIGIAVAATYLGIKAPAADRLRESGIKDRIGVRPLAHHRPFAIGALRHATRRRASGSEPREPRPTHGQG